MATTDTAASLATLPGRVKYARTLRGLTARDLGKSAGLSHATISAIENSAEGDGVRIGTARELARVLDVRPEWLAFGIGATPKESTDARSK
jgi:transcriptional regulator with XRE-family HTH domain